MPGLSMSCGYSQTTSLRLVLSTSQRQKVAAALLLRREQMLIALRGDGFQPNAGCPECSHVLTSLEILKGFSRDPYDYKTTCPKCSHRFPARFISRNDFGSIEVPFYCAEQTLEQIRHRQVFSPEVWKEKFVGVYYSALYHFGCLAEAYKLLNIEYPFKENLDWKDRLAGFLGQVPDSYIAQYAGVSAREVSKYRKEMGIQKYSKSYDDVLYE